MSLDLKNAPIIEAVIEFHCELPPGQDRAGWEAAFKQRFSADYPQCHAQHLQEVQFQMGSGGESPAAKAVRQGIHGFRHLSADGRQLVQCRADGFFFNRLAPYTSFDDYLPEALRCWALYREVAEPVIVRQVCLRYINRLLLPLAEGQLSLGKYLKNPPVMATPVDGETFSFVEFVHQHQIAALQSKSLVSVVLASQPLENAHLPLIFEIAAMRSSDFNPADHAAFQVALHSLRHLKNNVFANTLTPECLKLFQ
jgi:uncharacterized protein (TIGR04255 family)